jgi:hypothetical protein
MRLKIAWAIFGVGIILILYLQIRAIGIIYNNWGWNESHFAQHAFWPIMALAFALCIGSAFLNPGTFRKRICTAFFAALFATMVYYMSSLSIYVLYGA